MFSLIFAYFSEKPLYISKIILDNDGKASETFSKNPPKMDSPTFNHANSQGGC